MFVVITLASVGVGGEPYNPFKAKKKFIDQQHISVFSFNVVGH